MIGGLRGDDDARCFWIAWFIVRAGCRKGGIGRALWESLWTGFRSMHSSTHPTKPLLVGLCTEMGNTMRHFYERAGFLRAGPPAFLNDCSPWDMLLFKGTIKILTLKIIYKPNY